MGRLRAFLPPCEVDPADVPLMRRVAAIMFFAGAASSFLGVLTVQETPESRLAQSILASLLVILGVVVIAVRPSPALFRAGLLGAVGVVSAMIATANPISATEFFYLWPIVFAAYFLGRRIVAAALLWLAISHGAGLAVSADDIAKLDVFISTLSSVGIVGGVVTVMRERERRLTKGLREAARTDALTGILNRHGLEPELTRLVAESRRSGVPLAVALFDIDHFKRFNDRHGHLAGDEALRRVARALSAASRAGDCVARFGGEEFAVILPGAEPEGGRAYADRVAVALASEGVADALRLTASCGIAALLDGEEVDAALGRADEALYAAKDAGRNRTAWWRGERLVVGGPLGTEEIARRHAAARAPREFVVRMADRAREIEPEDYDAGIDGGLRRA